MNPLRRFESTVEEAIKSLGIDPSVCRGEEPQQWYLHRGRAQVIVALRESLTHTDNMVPTLVLMAPITALPKAKMLRSKYYEVILETNHQLLAEAFSISDNWIHLSASYEIESMELREISFALDSLSYYAHKFVEELRTEGE